LHQHHVQQFELLAISSCKRQRFKPRANTCWLHTDSFQLSWLHSN